MKNTLTPLLSFLVVSSFSTIALADEPAPTTVDAGRVAALEAKLAPFIGGLPAGEKAAWDLLLGRAAALGKDPSPVTLEHVFTAPEVVASRTRGTPGGRAPQLAAEREKAVAAMALIEGGLRKGIGAPKPPDPAENAGLIGPKQEDPGVPPNPTDKTGLIGPKQEDPGVPPNPTDKTGLIGPKQEDPGVPQPPDPAGLARALYRFTSDLDDGERGVLDWLVQRAARAPNRVKSPRTGTPGGAAPAVTLLSALGMTPVANARVEVWTLR